MVMEGLENNFENPGASSKRDRLVAANLDYLMMAKSPKKFDGAPMIVAMKGHPGSGKSTLAHSIASSLRLPLIDKDDVRDSTVPLQNLPTPTPPSLLNDLSYHAIWQIASTQLRLGLSVVVDSPLSRRAHLDSLIRVADSAGAAGLVVVECKPSDEAEWRRRLERRSGSSHKPATWRDLERLLEGYGACTEYDLGDVPKMVVDTTTAVGFEEICSGVLEFIASHGGPSMDYRQSSTEIWPRVRDP